MIFDYEIEKACGDIYSYFSEEKEKLLREHVPLNYQLSDLLGLCAVNVDIHGIETYYFDGKAILMFYPIESKWDDLNGKLTFTRKYRKL
jgi:hypothetical protein